MALMPKLDRLVGKYSNVLLRKVDLVDWDSAAADQAGRDFGLDGIPYVRVYGTRGNLLGVITDGQIGSVERAVQKEAK